jgi:hypothetical protein
MNFQFPPLLYLDRLRFELHGFHLSRDVAPQKSKGNIIAAVVGQRLTEKINVPKNPLN